MISPGASGGSRAVLGRGSPSLPARLLLRVLTAYHWTAPLRRPRCRFTPTCSSYAAEAIRVHGAAAGGWRALRRLLRCHPWHPGGVDPVPPPR